MFFSNNKSQRSKTWFFAILQIFSCYKVFIFNQIDLIVHITQHCPMKYGQ